MFTMNQFKRFFFLISNKSKFINLAKNYSINTENKFDLDSRIVNRTFQTPEIDPTKHNLNHEGLYYKLPDEIKNKVFLVVNWSKRQKFLFECYGEICLMIRKPALKIIDDINNNAIDNKLKKYILYGYPGVGQTTILNYLLHFAYKKNIVIVHLLNVFSLSRYPFEYTNSDYKKERIDTPVNSTILLQHFKTQNNHLINNLKTTKKYEWSLKEFTDKDRPLIDVIEHGLNRMNHASDCYAALLREIKIASNEGLIKTMVVIDGINYLFWPTDVKRLDKSYCSINEITVLRAINKFFDNDWKNGCIVATTSGRSKDKFEKHYIEDLIIEPNELLKPEGVKKLEPFEKIKVDCYSEHEFLNCLAYMNSINFLTHPKVLTGKGIEELQFVTNKNAFNLVKELRWL